jgi:hypothetical protein
MRPSKRSKTEHARKTAPKSRRRSSPLTRYPTMRNVLVGLRGVEPLTSRLSGSEGKAKLRQRRAPLNSCGWDERWRDARGRAGGLAQAAEQSGAPADGRGAP